MQKNSSKSAAGKPRMSREARARRTQQIALAAVALIIILMMMISLFARY